jgi:hypothetical protein
MSIGSDLLRVDKMIKHIELTLDDGIWNSGKNLEIAFYIEYADRAIKKIEKAPPPIFVHLYIEQKNKASELRRRWRAAKDRFPGKYLVFGSNSEKSNNS